MVHFVLSIWLTVEIRKHGSFLLTTYISPMTEECTSYAVVHKVKLTYTKWWSCSAAEKLGKIVIGYGR